MKKLINGILSYVDYLRENGVALSLSCIDEKFLHCYPVLAEYEVHCPLICNFMKQKNIFACARNKRELIKKNITEPTYGYCRAGVEEYVIPLLKGGKPILYVNVSGFRGKLEGAEKKRKRLSGVYGEMYDMLYSELKDDVPALESINRYIEPLLFMLDALYDEIVNVKTKENEVYTKCLAFIYENYTSDIKCSDIAEHVHYSESYVRHIFKQNCGAGVTDFIIKTRIEKACELLKSSNLSVAQVAMYVGFNDANYFSVKFKEYMRSSPLKYKKENR